MQYANLKRDWEFVMPPMYRLGSRQTIEPRSADGIVAMVHHPKSIAAFRQNKIPIVNSALTLPVEELLNLHLPTVLPDDGQVGRMAFDYLANRGFRQFGFCGHPRAAWSLRRRDAFVRACEERNYPCSCIAAADRVPSDWIASLPRPCAVLAANDRYAWHAIDVCRELNIAVPEQIAVLGVDNDALLAEMVRPTLSSIVLPTVSIGFEAGRMLDQLMQGKSISSQPLFFAPEGVMTRRSTDVLNIEDDVVADAVRFIRERAAQSVGVQDVLDHTLISRRNLERRFRRVLNRSVLDEIRRVHIERAARLLRDTDIDMPSISEQCGFSSPIRFST
ncbi:MAG TPA: DNA-binding transcriptional regulator, partial [Tepidisphaeraceae bacterium]|nr:DNA-binding transcriptional regulator [Tepidisphaeraceae bacterium]